MAPLTELSWKFHGNLLTCFFRNVANRPAFPTKRNWRKMLSSEGDLQHPYHLTNCALYWIWSVSYTRACETSAECLRSIYPSLGMRQLFRDVTMGRWRHNQPTELSDLINANHPVELIGIYVHINTHNKESLTQRCRRSTNIQLCLIFLYISICLSLNGWHALLSMAYNRHAVTITTHAIMHHLLIWMMMVRQLTKRRRSCV